MPANKTVQNRERERGRNGGWNKKKSLFNMDQTVFHPPHHSPRSITCRGWSWGSRQAGRWAAGQTGKGTAGLVYTGPGWAQTMSLAFWGREPLARAAFILPAELITKAFKLPTSRGDSQPRGVLAPAQASIPAGVFYQIKDCHHHVPPPRSPLFCWCGRGDVDDSRDFMRKR